MKKQVNCSQSILEKTLNQFINEGRTKFYLRDITRQAGVPIQEAEDFFVPLLKQDALEGKLEVRCPNCEAELGLYEKYANVPKELYCELCGAEFSSDVENLEIVLEVKSKFFRTQENATSAYWKKTY